MTVNTEKECFVNEHQTMGKTIGFIKGTRENILCTSQMMPCHPTIGLLCFTLYEELLEVHPKTESGPY